MAMLLSAAVGCSEYENTSLSVSESSQTVTEESTAAETAAASETPTESSSAVSEDTGSSSNAVSVAYSSYDSGVLDTADLFSDRDLLQTPDLSDAVSLEVSDGGTIDITEAGTYVLSGSANDCTVRVDAGSEAKVQLVLSGVSITNEDFPAIYVVSADKCFVTSAEGTENALSVSGDFTSDEETNTDAVIFSKDDLVLNGQGSLTVTSFCGNGISCKDDLKVTGGTYNITSALDAVEANDSMAICGGSFTISTGKDGFHCENDEDDSLGWIYIADGTFDIESSSDGIQGTTAVQIDGGSFSITSSEGIEATYVQINGGNIYIEASDDGINAARNSTALSTVIEFNGGETTIIMGQGDTDAVDANGSIYVNGGTIDITAPTSSFDYDQSAEYNGGTIIINGTQVSEIPSEMMGGPGGMGGGNFGGGMGGHGGFGGGRM